MSFLNSSNKYKTISFTCLVANIAYLILRSLYLVFFIIAKAYVLIWIDVVSILIYIACLFLIHRKKYYLYALLCGNEFFVFIITTTLMLGFNSGFHFYLIGLCIVSFFTSYFSKGRSTKGSIVWVTLSLAIYLTLFFVTRFNQPLYAIPSWMEMMFFAAHAVIVFSFVAFYLTIFVRYAVFLENRILNESRTDELTQLANRYGLYDYFNQESNKQSKVLALFDIDDFKLINDEFGHATGDYILKKVAELATDIFADYFVCRYGGEEFVAVVDKNNDFEILEKFRVMIEEATFEYEGNQHKITITIGAAAYRKDMTLEKWVSLADERMYLGKNSGKNKVVI